MPFDVERFICELHLRSSLWDVGCDEYSDREKKKKAWEELTNLFIEKEEATTSEKLEFARQIQRKWKSLRDCYARELKAQKGTKSGEGAKKRPVYMFFRQLSFLEKIVAQRKTTNSLTDNEDPSETMQTSTPRQSRLINAVERSARSKERENEVDCDKMFLLSLLGPLKQIPEHARFGVKRKLMEVIDTELQFLEPTYNSPIKTETC